MKLSMFLLTAFVFSAAGCGLLPEERQTPEERVVGIYQLEEVNGEEPPAEIGRGDSYVVEVLEMTFDVRQDGKYILTSRDRVTFVESYQSESGEQTVSEHGTWQLSKSDILFTNTFGYPRNATISGDDITWDNGGNVYLLRKEKK
jgi:hypothetical protein